MKKINRFFRPLLASIVVAAIASCNSGSQTKDATQTKTADTTAAVAQSTAAKAPEFKPFTVAVVTHTIKDYGKWRPIFDADSINRKAVGMEKIVVGREIDKPNNIMMVFSISELQKVKDFSNSPELKEKMKQAGVISKPEVDFFKVIRLSPDSATQWVEVTHKVKDFNAWLKVFDVEEGSAKRASDGMVDVVMARGIEDSNLIHLVFGITDLAKAKASIFSAEKKKLMMSAGVEGTPKIVFYQEAK